MIEGLSGRVSDAIDYLEMAMAEGDSSIAEDIERQFVGLETEIKQRELTRMLSGPVDHANAIIAKLNRTRIKGERVKVKVA